MPAAVTSGLGRNGPWLQNQWLRVETRQDNGSISPIALGGAFRPTERAAASVELAGGERLALERAEYDIQSHEDALGRGQRLTLISKSARRGITLTREVALYDARPFCVTRLGLTNNRLDPLPVGTLHVFTTVDDARGRLKLESPPDDWRIYRHGWQSWSPTMSFGGADRDVRSRRPELAPEDPLEGPGRFTSDDVGVLFDPSSGRSMLAGAITARALLTQVMVDAPGRLLDARCLADGVPLEPGETMWSERMAIDLVGHPNEQLERYGEVLGREMGARVPARTPSGWCSWYYFFTTVAEDDVVRNLRFLEKHRREMPIDTVQIDDGYQADIGDWLIANEKFPRGMAWLASEIKRAGFTPGLWLAPFLIAETSKTYAAHPDWTVRGEDGAPVRATNNWQRQNFGLDGSHPEARAWLTDLFREVCHGWGYDYVKIDFLYGGAIAGFRHDPRATRISAYRDALAAVREGVGFERFILGCGALMAPSVGYFDGNRIGPDVAPFWRNLTTAERAEPRPRARTPDDNLSAEVAIRNTLTRSWMHGQLWVNDPDCLLVRAGRTKLTLDETRTLASVIGLSAGMMLSSDDLEQVPPERIDLISMLLPVLPRSATPVDLLDRDMPERYDLVVDRDFDPLRIVGAFNFDDDARDVSIALPPGTWHVFELWEARYRGVAEGEVLLPLVAGHACRVLALRPRREVPQLVGTTAHIGIGALDVSSQQWDTAGQALRIGLTPAGKRERRVYVANAGLRPVRASLGGADVEINSASDDACYVDVAVDHDFLLEVRFEPAL